ncbi:hypothetical protein TNCV_598811 [Trichonephila clavipes]|nr:hypothetical protein TNCV_598811 [Trichonephila clavipes]
MGGAQKTPWARTIQNTIIYRSQGLPHSTFQNAKSFLVSDPLTPLICPQMFFPCLSLSDLVLLNCCHSTAPIRSNTFQLNPHRRRYLGTHCVFPNALRSPYREQTKHVVDASIVTPRTMFRNSIPGINEKTGISPQL